MGRTTDIAHVAQYPINLTLPGNQRDIQFRTFHSFINAFYPAKWVFFQIRRIDFNFLIDNSVSVSSIKYGSIISFQFRGGCRNYPETWREHEIDILMIGISLIDIIEFISNVVWIVDFCPVVYLGRMNFLHQLQNWQINLGKRQSKATALQILISHQYRKDIYDTWARVRPEGLPETMRRWVMRRKVQKSV